MMPPPAPGESTRHAVEAILKSIHWYIVYLILTLVSTLVAAALFGVVAFASAGPLSGALPGGTGRSALLTGSALGFTALLGLIALFAFVILVLAWAEWRTGAERLERAAGEYGPGAAAAASAGKASWLYATVIFLVGLITSIAVVVLITIATVARSFGPTARGNPAAITTSAAASLVELAIIVGIVSTVFSFLTYWFATRGLVGGFAPIAPPPILAQARSARTWVLLGAFLSVLDVAGYLLPFGSLLGVVAPLVILVGFWRLRGAYVAWLAAPPRPGAFAAGFPITPT